MSAPNLRELVESQGVVIDSWFYNQSNPNYESNQALLSRASNALYGDVGANLDVRNWDAIMASADPLTAAEVALALMYSNKQYLVANTEHVLKQGYAPEQADLTYQQMEDRVGASYDENWTEGTRFEGRIDTEDYLLTLDRLESNPAAAQAYQDAKVEAAKVDAPVVTPPAPVITPVIVSPAPAVPPVPVTPIPVTPVTPTPLTPVTPTPLTPVTPTPLTPITPMRSNLAFYGFGALALLLLLRR